MRRRGGARVLLGGGHVTTIQGASRPCQVQSTGEHSGQVSPMPSRISAFSRAAVSGQAPGGGGSVPGHVECPFARVLIRTILHPAVFFALVDGAGLHQHGNRPATNSPKCRSACLRHQHRDHSRQDESSCPCLVPRVSTRQGFQNGAGAHFSTCSAELCKTVRRPLYPPYRRRA